MAFVVQEGRASVVVESVEKNFGGQRAGLTAGDVLESWSRGEASGKILSRFDLMDAEMEQAPRGTVTLQGQRNSQPQVWSMPPDSWRIVVRPVLAGTALTLYEEATKLETAAKPLEAAQRWRALAADAGDPDVYAFLLRSAEALARAHLWKDCDDDFQNAVSRAESNEPAVLIWLQRLWADTFRRRNDFDNAEKHYQQALNQRGTSEDLKRAATLWDLGDLALKRGALSTAEELLGRSLEIQQKLAPDSLPVAHTLNRFGIAAWHRGDLSKSEDYYRQALKIFEKQLPDGTEVAGIFNNLGIVAWNRGDLSQAGEYYRETLKRWEVMSPGSLDVARCLDNLGIVASSSGDYGKAEVYHRQALKIREKLAPQSLELTHSLNNLGMVAQYRGKLSEADKYYRESLDIKERIAPDSLEVAVVLHNLGDVAWGRRDLDQAEEYFRRALELKEKLAPGSLMVASSLDGLGSVAFRRRNIDEAEQYYRRALIIRERLAPESVDFADSLARLGSVDFEHRRFPEARSLFERAIAIVEAQRSRLPSTEARAFLLAKNQHVYTELLRADLALNDLPAAFHASERARARSLLDLMAAAHVDVRDGADPDLLQRERALQRELNAKARQQTRLLGGKHSEEEAAALAREISATSAKFDEVETAIRAASPHYAALTQPQPLQLAEVQRQVLDKDTLLLEYSLGEEGSYLFAVSTSSIRCFELPKRAEIERQARRAYELLAAPSLHKPGESYQQEHVRLAQTAIDYPIVAARLSRMVLAPVAGRLGRKRLLIVADGALQQIPFATLPDPASPTNVPLVAAHEIVNLPSASVVAVQRRDLAGRQPATKEIAIFADPVFERTDERVKLARKPADGAGPKLVSQDREIKSPQIHTEGMGMPRLRHSREEGGAILAFTPRERALYAVDFDATKAAATGAEMGRFRILHFATHTLLDNDHPELSGIVLSLFDRQGKDVDGFLRLNEIYNLRLHADLVVLSGCQTALGQQVRGEGLIGLTRGFLYAGAARVVASLWKVDDLVTARLMGRFYEGLLREKKTAAAALRQAQLEMSRDRLWHDPYYWAGFELQGEWK